MKSYSNKKYEVAVVLGRMQILTNAHVNLINKALDVADYVIVCVGSPWVERTQHNPFSYEERKTMIRSVFPNPNILVVPVPDVVYDDTLWKTNFKKLIETHVWQFLNKHNYSVRVIGHTKDGSQSYLKELGFPFVDQLPYLTDEGELLHASDLRKIYFSLSKTCNPRSDLQNIKRNVPESVFKLLQDFRLTSEYEDLVASETADLQRRGVTIIVQGDSILLALYLGKLCLPTDAVMGPAAKDNLLKVCVGSSRVTKVTLQLGELEREYKANHQDAKFEMTSTKVNCIAKIMGDMDAPNGYVWVKRHKLQESEVLSDHYPILQSLQGEGFLE